MFVGLGVYALGFVASGVYMLMNFSLPLALLVGALMVGGWVFVRARSGAVAMALVLSRCKPLGVNPQPQTEGLTPTKAPHTRGFYGPSHPLE